VGGVYTVTVTANDGPAFDSQSFNWVINSPISFTTVAAQNSTEGTAITTVTLSASDGDDTMVYSAIGLPPGLVLNASTGAITGTPSVGDASSGPFSVTLQAATGAYTAEQEVTWNVVSPITTSPIADQTGTENVAISTLDVSATDSIEDSTLVYSATGLPPGLKIAPSTGAITGTPAIGSAAMGSPPSEGGAGGVATP
jgi:hypothetical protein